MAENKWTVGELTEALQQFPLDAKVYYETGPNGPAPIGQAKYVKAWGRGRRNGSPAGSIAPDAFRKGP